MASTDWDGLVRTAVDELLAEGKQVTRAAVRAKIGGSPNVIGPLIKKHVGEGASPVTVQMRSRQMQHAIEARIAAGHQARAIAMLRRIGECGVMIDQSQRAEHEMSASYEPHMARWNRSLARLRRAEERASERGDEAYRRLSSAQHGLLVVKEESAERVARLSVVQERLAAQQSALQTCRRETARAAQKHTENMARMQARMAQVERELAVSEKVVVQLSAEHASMAEQKARLGVLEAEVRRQKA